MFDESDYAGDGLGAFKTAVNRTIRVWSRTTGYGLISLFIFWIYTYFLSCSIIILDSLLSCAPINILFSPLILLWACDSVGVFGLIGFGLYSRCPCLLLFGGVSVGKSPTLLQFRVSLLVSSMLDFTSLVTNKKEWKGQRCL